MYICKHKKLEVGENSVEKAGLKYLKELKEPREDFLFIPGLKNVEKIACIFHVYGSTHNTHLWSVSFP